jgi:hypothetical protein
MSTCGRLQRGSFCFLLTVSLMLAAAGCSNVPRQYVRMAERDATFKDLVTYPEKYQGKVVLLGGDPHRRRSERTVYLVAPDEPAVGSGLHAPSSCRSERPRGRFLLGDGGEESTTSDVSHMGADDGGRTSDWDHEIRNRAGAGATVRARVGDRREAWRGLGAYQSQLCARASRRQ